VSGGKPARSLRRGISSSATKSHTVLLNGPTNEEQFVDTGYVSKLYVLL